MGTMRLLRIMGLAAMALLFGTVVFLATSCCSNRHEFVTADHFVYVIEKRPVNPVAHAEFIGVAGDRAYLREWRKGGWWNDGGHHVLSVALQDLPPGIAAELRRGGNPWKTKLPVNASRE
jgi:hypothetical protein